MSFLPKSALVAILLAPSALAANLFVSHFNGNIYTLTYESQGLSNSSLSIDSVTTGCGNMPSWLTLDEKSRTLYCFDESWGGGVVSSFDISNGSLELTGQAETSGGDVHGYFYGGEDENSFLATAAYGDSSISTYKLPLTADTEVLQQESFTLPGTAADPLRQDPSHPHASFTDPGGRFLMVPDLGADLIRIFAINASTGYLKACPSVAANPGDGPRHGTWWTPKNETANESMLYIINELENSVSAYQVSYPNNGCLSLNKTQTLSTFELGNAPPSDLPVKSAEIHVKGDFLYVSNRNGQSFGSGQDSLVTYNISSTGVLDFVEATNAHGWHPRTLSINTVGDLVAVGGQNSSNVAIIARDVETGRLGELLATVDVGALGNNGEEDGLSAVMWDTAGETIT